MNAFIHRLRRRLQGIATGYFGVRDADAPARDIVRRVEQFTMTTHERLFGLIQAVRYVARAELPGAMVECGVWRGGSCMAAALTLIEAAQPHRDLYLFDTFEGMSAPTDADRDWRGHSAAPTFERAARGAGKSSWCYASLEDVQANMASTGYDTAKLHYVRGKVEDTVPREAPAQIALLRLDTDWYESTRHELVHLYPRLVRGGVLILDDYGHWEGARRAVDEYFAENGIAILLNRLDPTGRIALKP